MRRRTADRSLQDKVEDTIQEETLQGNQTEQVTPIQLRDGYGEDVHSQDQITNTGPFPLDCDTKFAFVLRGRLPNDVTDCATGGVPRAVLTPWASPRTQTQVRLLNNLC